MKKTVKFLLMSLMALQLLFVGAAHASFRVVLNVNESMVPDRPYFSPNGRYFVVFQSTDGNLVVYRGSEPLPSNAIWFSGARQGTQAVLQNDANFVIYRGETIPQNAVWASNTDMIPNGMAPPFVSLSDDGSLTVAVWGAQVKFQTPPDATGPNCTVRQYPICVFPGTFNQFNSFVLACTIAEAQRQAAATGAVFGTCH
ncbi:hypothetical protein PO883_03200 [Massilia sp. DJPM01]|uniref:hypothetical protein n=1 Tax=Massilia sp. DJPM01 TaxID=3024404 RepID=UPI00259F76D3|nr:hypothetical protein [Massilia sp. DJPM01]MDM5176196.1 hypothetical protein [Massilia sp. DJPM01]